VFAKRGAPTLGRANQTERFKGDAKKGRGRTSPKDAFRVGRDSERKGKSTKNTQGKLLVGGGSDGKRWGGRGFCPKVTIRPGSSAEWASGLLAFGEDKKKRGRSRKKGGGGEREK